MEKKRIKFRLKHPNPLFEQWLTQMYTTAVAESNPAQIMFKKALISLKKYPLTLESGSECAIIKGFGKKLCALLDEKLAEYRSKENLNMLPIPTSNVMEINEENLSNLVNDCEMPSIDSIPLEWSGEYAILMTIFKHKNSEGLISKNYIEKYIQQYCKEVCLNQNSCLNASIWKCINNLIERDFIKWDLDSDYFSLKPNGENSVKSMLKKNSTQIKFINNQKDKYEETTIKTIQAIENNGCKPFINVNHISSFKENSQCDMENKPMNNKTVSQFVEKHQSIIKLSRHCKSNEIDNVKNIKPKLVLKSNNMLTKRTFPMDRTIGEEQDTIVFMPNSFDVVLLVDKQENSGVSKKSNQVVTALENFKMINFELRHLKVGDFAWVARHRLTQEELILPYIIERKRIDDLAKSIKDGRFHEQKFRLNSCGVSNVIYLVEHYGDMRHCLPLSTLMQATVNTRIQNGFSPHFTSSLTDSIKFLAMMTKNLQDKYEDKTLKKSDAITINENGNTQYLIGFQEFNKSSAKSKILSVADLFIKQLLQLKGVSIEKALAIVSVYSTPINLINAYKNDEKPETLLTRIKSVDKKGNINISISKTIYQFFTKENFK